MSDAVRISDKTSGSNEKGNEDLSVNYQEGARPLMQAADTKALRSLPGCSIDGADPFIATSRLAGGRPEEMNVIAALFKNPVMAMPRELAKTV